MSTRNLPDFLQNASEKTFLDLSGMGLESLPTEIGQLTQLTRLNLRQNRLTTLPATIGKLTRLRELLVDDNYLTSIPEEIGNLSALREVSLTNNHLPELPEEMLQLEQLESLKLMGNPLPVPQMLKDLTARQVLAQILTEQERRRINEIKMLVLGPGGAGKTSIIKRLVERHFDDNQLSTSGCQVQRWPVQVGKKRIAINVWDFGRQETETGIYRFFVSPRSFYLLVWDADRDSSKGDIEDWLKLIRQFGQNSPIIVVLNKTDAGNFELDRRDLQMKYPDIKAFINVSAMQNFGMIELRDALKQTIGDMESLREAWPAGWASVKNRLDVLEKPIIDYQEFAKICMEEEIAAEDRDLLLTWLHDLGTISHFQGHLRLRNMLVLDPEWLGNAAVKLLSQNSEQPLKEIVSAGQIGHILTENGYSRQYHPFFMDLLAKFHLCYPLGIDDGSAYLFPQWFSRQPPNYRWEDSALLTFQYKFSHLPPNIIAQIVRRMYNYVQDQVFWKYGVLLSDGENAALVRLDDYDQTLSIFINGRKPTRRDFLAKIRFNLEQIRHEFPYTHVEEFIPLPDMPSLKVDYQHLLMLSDRGVTEFIPEGQTEAIDVRELLEGDSNDRRFSVRKLKNLQKELVMLNARAERLWLKMAQEVDGDSQSRMEEQIGVIEQRRDDVIATIQETREQLQQNAT